RSTYRDVGELAEFRRRRGKDHTGAEIGTRDDQPRRITLSEGKAHEAVTPLSELDVDFFKRQWQAIVEWLCRMPCLDFDHVGSEQQAGRNLLAKRFFERRHHGGAVYAQRDLVSSRATFLAVNVARRHVLKLGKSEPGICEEHRCQYRNRNGGGD